MQVLQVIRYLRLLQVINTDLVSNCVIAIGLILEEWEWDAVLLDYAFLVLSLEQTSCNIAHNLDIDLVKFVGNWEEEILTELVFVLQRSFYSPCLLRERS
jgi:hypothetical protein